MVTMVDMIPVFLILFGVLALNMPVYIALLSAGLYMQIVLNHMPLQGVVSAMFESVTKNSMLAIPFFILAGVFMSGGSLGERLITMCSAFLRSMRAGMSMACLLANALFGAISGSPPAATATFSKIMYEPLREQYGEKQALGLIVGAAGLSSVIPPSVGMIIYGVVAEVSIARLFMAGILPGLLLVLIIGIYLFTIGKSDKGFQKATREEKSKSLVRAIPVLILPVIILGGIYGGVFTPTEAGAVSAAYAALVSIFVLKDMSFKKFLAVLKDGTITSAQVFILLSCCGVFAQALTVTRVPLRLVDMFEGVHAVGFLIILNIILLVFGCFFDSSAAILILVPLLTPTAMALGINPIHLGIVYVVNLTIGMFTPPFGLNLFVAQGVLQKELMSIAKAALPFVGLYLIGMVFITYFPSISLLLPGIFM